MRATYEQIIPSGAATSWNAPWQVYLRLGRWSFTAVPRGVCRKGAFCIVSFLFFCCLRSPFPVPSAGVAIAQIENRSCLGLTLATLPGVKVQPFYLADMDVPDPFDPPAVWTRAVQLRDADAGQEGEAGVGEPIFLSYSTTTSIDALGDYMAGMDQAFPRSQKIGSIASTVSR